MVPTLVVETLAGGHAHLHLKFLVDSLFHAGSMMPEIVWFYVSPQTVQALAKILPEQSMALFRANWIPAQPKSDLTDVLNAALRVGAGHILFLHIDSFLYAIARNRTTFSISGVWFRPNYHYSSVGMIYEGVGQTLIALLKEVTARLLCARREIRQLFVFDKSAAAYSTRRFRTDKIRYIPDPFAFDSMAPTQRICAPGVSRQVFLIAGALSRRKGMLPVLKALNLLSRETQTLIQLKLVGMIRDEDRADILRAIATARKTTAVAIDHVDEFVSDEAMDVALMESDTVLLLYQKFIGSSGMLIRAALHKKPVLATKFGLVGSIVRDEKLGLTVDPYSPRAIANAITHILNHGHLEFDNESAKRFAANHRPTQYAERLRDLIIEVAKDGDGHRDDERRDVRLTEHHASS
jgi:glycosyltransferase involved in cell wall biosynthesis